MQKNWCFWIVVLEKTLESPLDFKEIQPVHPKGNQFLIFIGRTDAEAETPIFWPPHEKCWLIGQDPDAGKDWGQEKGMTEGEMAGWYHWLDGHEFEWTWSWWWTGRPGVLQFMGSQRVRHDWATELNWTELNWDAIKNICDSLEEVKISILMKVWKKLIPIFMDEFERFKTSVKEVAAYVVEIAEELEVETEDVSELL